MKGLRLPFSIASAVCVVAIFFFSVLTAHAAGNTPLRQRSPWMEKISECNQKFIDCHSSKNKCRKKLQDCIEEMAEYCDDNLDECYGDIGANAKEQLKKLAETDEPTQPLGKRKTKAENKGQSPTVDAQPDPIAGQTVDVQSNGRTGGGFWTVVFVLFLVFVVTQLSAAWNSK